MYCAHFSYNGESSMDHSVVICSFDNDGTISGGTIEMSTVKAPNSNKWYKTNATYKEPLSFVFCICKDPCSFNNGNDIVMTANDQVDIKRWLLCKDNKWLKFNEDGFEDVFYNAQLSLEENKVGGRIIGYKITAICDAPWGWSEERTAILDVDTTEIFDNSDEIGAIVPIKTTITVTEDGQVRIYNDNTMEETRINNCKNGEIITFTELFGCETNNEDHDTLYDDFNWVFPKIQNSYIDNRNSFELKNCTVKMQWREPRKAVI